MMRACAGSWLRLLLVLGVGVLGAVDQALGEFRAGAAVVDVTPLQFPFSLTEAC